jgi:hypothetical protein
VNGQNSAHLLIGEEVSLVLFKRMRPDPHKQRASRRYQARKLATAARTDANDHATAAGHGRKDKRKVQTGSLQSKTMTMTCS